MTTEEQKLVDKWMEKNKLIDMFPYKIQDVKAFYKRDHPVNLHPETKRYRDYWSQIWKEIIDGRWVLDNDTWVFLFPKLDWYINLTKMRVEDEKNKTFSKAHPDLTDVEWIQFTYLYCCIGFSGFRDDKLYTCNKNALLEISDEELIEKTCWVTDRDTSERVFVQRVYDNLFYEDKRKEYRDPWEYLRHYMDYSKDGPLGEAIYANQASNFGLLCARGTGKTMSSIGDLTHEWSTGGIKYSEDIKKLNRTTIELFIGTSESKLTADYIAKFKDMLNSLPGGYELNGEYYPNVFHRETKGSWSEKSSGVRHVYDDDKGNEKGSKSRIKFAVVTKEKPTGASGIRGNRIVYEEIGLMGEAIDQAHATNVDSLKINGTKFGLEYCLGTSGEIRKVQSIRPFFYSPEAYDYFGIPNYWANPDKKIWLFIPKIYAYRKLKDRNGNTKFTECLLKCLQEREKKKDSADFAPYEFELMFNPLTPGEMFINAQASLFPSVLLQQRLDEIEEKNIVDRKSTIGTLRRDTDENVRFIPDLHRKLKPIMEYPLPKKLISKEGAVVIWEFPISDHINTNRNLYSIIYDSVKDEGDGTSLCSVIVYKDFHKFDGEAMEGTIVAEWIGRYQTQSENHNMALMLTDYYNGLMFPETDVGGIINHLRLLGRLDILHKYPTNAMSKILKNPVSDKNKLGYKMSNIQTKLQCEKWLKEWLLTPRDDETLNLDHLYSPVILKELIDYNRDDNFDYVSTMLGLMMLLKNVNTSPVVDTKLLQKETSLKDLFSLFDKGEIRYIS